MKKALTLFSAMFIFLSGIITCGTTVYAGGDAYTSEDYDHFVIEKVWNDQDNNTNNRPSEVTVHLQTASGEPVGEGEYKISEADNWRLVLSFPHSDEDYFVKEDPIENYLENEFTNDWVKINKITVPEYLVDGQPLYPLDSFYDWKVSKVGFDSLPVGDIIIDSDLDLREAEINIPSGAPFSYISAGRYYNSIKSADPMSDEKPMIVYTGPLPYESNPDHKFTITFKGKAHNRLLPWTNYDVVLTVTPHNIEGASDTTGEKQVALLANTEDKLHAVSYYTTENEYSDIDAENVVGASLGFTVSVFTEQGNPVSGYTQMCFSDIDLPSYLAFYRDQLTDPTVKIEDYYATEYVESISIDPASNIYSDFHLSPDSWLYDNAVTFFNEGTHQNLKYDPTTTVAYLSDLESNGFIWDGSYCGTALFYKGEYVDVYPTFDEFTTKITNEIDPNAPVKPNPVGSVKVIHKDIDTDEILKEELVIEAEAVGENYEVESQTFENYTFVKHDENSAPASGQISEGLTTVVFLYEKDEEIAKTGSIIVEHRDYDTSDLLKPSAVVVKDAPVGTDYITSKETFENYTFLKMNSESAPASGKVVEGTSVVIYLYRKNNPDQKTGSSVLVQYLDEETKLPLIQTVTLMENKPIETAYEAERKAFDNYVFYALDKNSAPEKGKVSDKLQTVILLYKKQYTEEYSFKSESGDKLPNDVLKQLPTRKNKFFNKDVVKIENFTPKDVKVDGGTWKFVSWNYTEQVVNNANVSFVGTWKFVKDSTPSTPSNTPVNTGFGQNILLYSVILFVSLASTVVIKKKFLSR